MATETAGRRTRGLRIGLSTAGGAAAGAALGWAVALRNGGDPALYVPVFAAAVGPVAGVAFWMLVLNSAETRRIEAAGAADVERSWSRDAAAAAFTDVMVVVSLGVVLQAVAGWTVPLPLFCAAGLAAWALRYAAARRRNA